MGGAFDGVHKEVVRSLGTESLINDTHAIQSNINRISPVSINSVSLRLGSKFLNDGGRFFCARGSGFDMSSIKYYEKVLQGSWPGMDDQLKLLQGKCDSQLEILFGLALCQRYCDLNDMRGYRNDLGYPSTEELGIRLMEPFGLADSGGVSTAYIIPQVVYGKYKWDFAILTGDDNGFGLDKCKLAHLVEIDGYGIHRTQRAWDLKKSKSVDVSVIRVIEERFKDPYDMADAVLHETIMCCCSGYNYATDEPEEICDLCRRRASLLVKHQTERAF